MHILYISQYFPPEMGAPAARVHELSREWVRLGHRVTVLTGFPNHPTGVLPPEYRGEIFRREEKDGIEVIRTWLYAAPNKGITKRILNYLSFPASALLLGIPALRGCDVVIATSPQFFVAGAGYLAATWLGRPFVFEVRDLWPDSIEAVEAITNRWMLAGLRGIEEFLYRRATMIVGVARSTPRILTERGFDPTKMVVIPNGVDLELFRSGARENDIRKPYTSPDGFLVSYIGTHGMAQGLNTVLETAEMLQEQRHIRFLLVGEGAEKEQLVKHAQERQLKNVTFLGQQPRQKLPAFYQASDVCLVPLRRTPLFRSVLPSKLFEIMGTGRPIILGVEGESRELLEEAKAGLAITPESPEALSNAILKLAAEPELGRWFGENGRRYMERFYSRPVLAKKYLSELEKLVR